MNRIKNIIKTLFNIINKPEMVFLPANVAFFIVLSVFPILTLVGILASYLSLSVDGLIITLESALPNSLTNLLTPYIINNNFDSNTIIFTVVAFVLASNGSHALILSSNSLYKIENSNYIKRRIKALFLILLLILLFMFLLSFLAYGNQIFRIILEIVTYSPVNKILYYIFSFIKWPIAMLIIYIIIKIIYILTPDDKIYSKTTTKGALFTTIGWTIATAIFSFYVSNFAHYDIYYGSISSIIVLMIWVYILSYILMVGIAINVGCYNKLKRINSKEMENI